MPRTFAILLCSTTFVAAAAPAGATESTIRPGVGIGKVELGMTKTQVQRVFGGVAARYAAKTVDRTHYVEYAWDWSNWRVTFEQRGETLRAFQVATQAKTQRTANGLGLGSRWLAVVRAYPGGRCAFGGRFFQSEPTEHIEYLVPRKGGNQTIFNFVGIIGNPYDPGTPRIVGYEVAEVRVRSPFEPLDEFGAKRQYRCSDDWRKTDAPEKLPA